MQAPQQYLRSFGRKKSRRLRPNAEAAITSVLPELTIREIADLPQGFKETWLEIGFGGGEHLIHQAKNNPDVGFIGCEPFINGMAKLLREIEENNLKNIRLFDDDFRLLAEKMPDDSIDKAFILFPDPWPKKKQNKRRLIQKPLLDILARILKPGAILRVATDDMDYAKWIMTHLLARDDFTWLAESKADWQTVPPDHTLTKYQKKACEAGRIPVFMHFSKKIKK